jgi:hypothetical protein
MNKDILTSAIEKYHLGGNVESTKWVIKDKTLSIRFLSENKNLVGILETPNFDLEDCELPVYSTTQLYKLVKITDNFVQLGITKGRANIVNELNISDNQYDLHYHLADAAMIEEPDTIINSPFWNDAVAAERDSKLPRLCLMICAIFWDWLFYFLLYYCVII